MEQPERVLPQAIASIRHIEETQQKERLLAALVSLLPNEEVTKMVEKFLEQDEVIIGYALPAQNAAHRLGKRCARRSSRGCG